MLAHKRRAPQLGSLQFEPVPPDPNAVGIGATFSGLITLNMAVLNGFSTPFFLQMVAGANVGNLSTDHTPAFFFGGASSDFFDTATIVGVDFFDADGKNVSAETSYSFSDGLQVPTGMPVTTTPEPGSMAMVASGLALIGAWRRRRSGNAAA